MDLINRHKNFRGSCVLPAAGFADAYPSKAADETGTQAPRCSVPATEQGVQTLTIHVAGFCHTAEKIHTDEG